MSTQSKHLHGILWYCLLGCVQEVKHYEVCRWCTQQGNLECGRSMKQWFKYEKC